MDSFVSEKLIEWQLPELVDHFKGEHFTIDNAINVSMTKRVND